MKNSHSVFLSLLLSLFLVAGYGQFTDDFSDGDFSSNPAWTATAGLFMVENNQLRSNSSGAATYSITTPSTAIDDAQWEFYINLNFSTSGANFVDVYLVAESSDLSATANGYFLRFGGTPDEISFYRRAAGANTVIIDGEDGVVGSSANNIFRVRMQRSAAGEWSLEYDDGDTGTFVSGGTVTDDTIASSAFFGISITQSSAASVVNNHFFDDFFLGAIPVDNVAPEVLGVSASSSSEVQILFTEPVDAASVANLGNYEFPGTFFTAVSAALSTVNPALVEIDLPDDALQNGENYSITLMGISDLSGNTVEPVNVPFSFFEPEMAEFKDVVFNEIFADPTPVIGLPSSEFIEIYNASNRFFDLEEWKLVNSDIEKVLTGAVLPPNSYAILTNSSNAEAFASFGAVIGIPSFTALSNGGDSLMLINPDGLVIDIVNYTDAWYGDPAKAGGGYTLELINPFTECSGMSNWLASDDLSGGTPGAENSIFDDSPDISPPSVTGYALAGSQGLRVDFSERMDANALLGATYDWDSGLTTLNATLPNDLRSVTLGIDQTLATGVSYLLTINGAADCEGNLIAADTQVEIIFGESPAAGDLRITEIMADPNPVVGLPEAEYFEIFNASDRILELSGIRVGDDDFLTSRIMQPGSYLFCYDPSLAAEFVNFPNGYEVAGLGTSYFTNTGRTVELFNADGQLLDALTYQISWYNDPDKDDGGYALELINTETDCSGQNNWRASTADAGGTPGVQNSVFNLSPDLTPPVVSGYSVEAPNLVRVFFSEPLAEATISMSAFLWSSGVNTEMVLPAADLSSVDLMLSSDLITGDLYELSFAGITDCIGNALPAGTTIEIRIGETPQRYELLITEIMADPSPSVALPEGEYFELFNASDQVLELQNCKLNDKTFSRSRVLLPGAYLLCADRGLELEFADYPDVYFFDGLGATYFTNGGRSTSLFNPEGILLDKADYDLSWYRDSEKEDGGYSLERINLTEPCRGGNNWMASDDERGGTPGEVNSLNSLDPDIIPPVPALIYVRSATSMELVFNEAIDPESSTTASISIAPEIDIANRENIAPAFERLTLSLASPIQNNTIYTISINGFSDCSGNEMQSSVELRFALPETGLPGDILINEILFNPRTGGSDFVELVNVSNKTIGLQNWVLQNQDFSTRSITGEPLNIFPGEYLVLTVNPENIAQEYPFGRSQNYFQMEALPSYNNGDGAVIIADPLEQAIDRFDYNEDYHFSLLNSFKGVSLERLSFTRPTNDAGNWTSAAENVGFATPGYLNSQFNREGMASANFKLENEIFSPDNDGFQDILNINYTLAGAGYLATVKVYDRRGREVAEIASNDLLQTQGTISWDGVTDQGTKARIGPHIIFIEVFDLNGNTESYKLPCIVGGRLSD